MFSRSRKIAGRFPLLQRLLSKHFASNKGARGSKRYPYANPPRFPSGYQPALNHQPTLNHASFKFQQSDPSNRIKYARWSAAMATCMGTSIGLVWLFYRDKVPVTERKKLNFLSDDWMLRNAHHHNLGAHTADALLTVSLLQPAVLWPKDHPVTLSVNGIFERLVATAAAEFAINPEDWKIDVITMPEHNDIIATEDGHFMVSSNSLTICKDESTLALLLSIQIAVAAAKVRAESLSDLIFKGVAAILLAQLAITAFFLPVVWTLAIPYTCLYGVYLWAHSDILLQQTLDEYYLGMIIMHKAGYDLDAVLKFHMNQKKMSDELLAVAQHAPEEVLTDGKLTKKYLKLLARQADTVRILRAPQ